MRTPLLRNSATVSAIVSHINAISCRIPLSQLGPSPGCTPSSAGGSAKMSQPPAASTDGKQNTSRNIVRSASGSDVYNTVWQPIRAMGFSRALILPGLQATLVICLSAQNDNVLFVPNRNVL